MSRIILALVCALFGLSAALPARAATLSIVSMKYSTGHPVPHFHYEGGTVDGDVETLRNMYESFVKCRLACIGPEGGATAVLTMNGPGGSYLEGLRLADFLRENHIATVVERGMRCYSACAFGFLPTRLRLISRTSACAMVSSRGMPPATCRSIRPR